MAHEIKCAGRVGMRNDDDIYDDELLTDADALAICTGDDCRAPRAGPFVTDHESGQTYCYACFASDVLYIDPNEVGLL